ncbi:hypothetical protein ACI2IY_11130 [Lysobacter enzymogenes]|uniref:hypothetical protein n=1 Tax=Lysobacter enzymogenes TaxID=69 RepID=UPI00384AF164
MAWMLAAAVAVGADGVPPQGWVAVDPPKTGTELECANLSRDYWKVEAAGAGVHLSQANRRRRTAMVGAVLRDGALVGYNHGEFGGSIEWWPRDGGARFELLHVNPVEWTLHRGDAVVAEGLIHLGARRGAVLRFERRDGRRWRIHRLAELDAAPVAALRESENSWLLLLYDGLVRVDLASGRAQRLYRNSDWTYLAPDTIRPLGDGWLLGSARGAIRLEPVAGGGYRERLWVPRQCASLQPPCSCGDP